MSPTAEQIVSVVDAPTLISVANRNFGVIQKQINGLTHADSLLQLPFRGNCLNWVMGHITQSRDKMLQLVDQPSVWTPEQIARYERDSAPILENGADVLPFEKIVTDLTTAHERLVEALKDFSLDDLAAVGKGVIKNAPPWNIAEWLHFLLWIPLTLVLSVALLRLIKGVLIALQYRNSAAQGRLDRGQ